MRDGVVHGFFVHVADATPLKTRERELAAALAERDQALAEVRTLRGEARFSHGLCPSCATTLYPDLGPHP